MAEYFGKLLKAYRNGNHLTQAQLAEIFSQDYQYPVTNVQINRYENGRRTPSGGLVFIMGKALRLSDDQHHALFNAAIASITKEFLDQYEEAKQRHNQGENK